MLWCARNSRSGFSGSPREHEAPNEDGGFSIPGCREEYGPGFFRDPEGAFGQHGMDGFIEVMQKGRSTH